MTQSDLPDIIRRRTTDERISYIQGYLAGLQKAADEPGNVSIYRNVFLDMLAEAMQEGAEGG